MPPSQPLLILLAVIGQWGIGRLFVAGFFSRMVLGTCITGALVAILANVCAGLIFPVVVVSQCVGWALTLIHRNEFTVPSWKLLLLGVVLFWMNSAEYHLFDRTSGHVKYEVHFSMYADQATEMLRADYMSRLRLSRIYPCVWARYHFFKTAVIAAAEGFVSHPSLFSYWNAQVILYVLALLSFIEGLPLMVGFLWLFGGTILFSDSLHHLYYFGNGLAVFGLIQAILSLQRKNMGEALVYSWILAMTSFQFFAAGAFLTVLLLFIDLGWRRSLFKIVPLYIFGVIYSAATFLAPAAVRYQGTDPFFSPLMWNRLFSYKWIGYLLSPWNLFPGFDSTQYFFGLGRIGLLPAPVGLSITAIAIALLIFRKRWWLITPSILLATTLLYLQIHLGFMMLAWMPYLVLFTYLIGVVPSFLLVISASLQLVCWILQGLGVGEIFSPLLALCFDTLSWGLLLVALPQIKTRVTIAMTSAILLMLPIFRPNLFRMFMPRSYSLIDVTSPAQKYPAATILGNRIERDERKGLIESRFCRTP